MSDSGFQMHHRRKFRTRSPLVVALDLFLFATTPLFARSGCIPIHEASQHVGEVKCVSGKVLHVKVGDKGVHFVGFCADQAACPFRVVVFAADLKDVAMYEDWKASNRDSRAQ